MNFFKKIFKKKVKSQEDYYLASQWVLMGRKLKKHKLARVSMVILGILYFAALFGQFLAPYGLEEFDGLYRNSAPTKIYWIHEGEYVGPYVCKLQKTIDKTIAHMDSLPDKKAKDEYMKFAEKELKKQYTPRLKKLTFSQGKMLIKLVDRQCNQTSYELIKTYMGGFKAGFYNAFASLFGASLKKEYDPEVDDRLTERCILLIESGQM